MKIHIDLFGCKNSSDLFRRLGEILLFGGTENRGWGMNRDALIDSLCELNNGGIWGDSPKVEYPITLIFYNVSFFTCYAKNDYDLLIDILKQVEEYYVNKNQEFSYLMQ